MSNAVAVRYRFTYTDSLIDSGQVSVSAGDHVIVRTERGQEVALATEDTHEVSSKELADSKGRQGAVMRIASEEDLARAADLAERGSQATSTFRELIAKHKLDMKPVHTEFLFDGEKAVFYFASEGRVDFRELVRELAAEYHVRIDMRQIGVRDEARQMGGLSHCGQELCCARMGGEFHPVTIRMAKEQDLPLNPSKISGLCGRLMCCLRYEFEAYKDFKGRAPKKGAMIETPEGLAKVVEFDTPRETVTLRFENGQNVVIPVSEMSCNKEDEGGEGPCRPNCVSAEVLQAHMQGAIDAASRVSGVERTLEDGEVETDVKNRVGRSARRHHEAVESGKNAGQSKGKGEGSGKSESRKPRRRRRGSSAPKDASSAAQRNDKAKQEEGASEQKKQGSGSSRNRRRRSGSGSGPRPGQNSSGAKRGNIEASAGQQKHHQQNQSSSEKPARQGSGQGRRKPRRRHSASGKESSGSQGNQE